MRATKLPKEKFYKDLRFYGWFTVKTEDVTFKMHHHGATIENEIFWKGIQGYEKYSLKIWTLLSKNSKVIVDVGANSGIYTLLAAAENTASAILSFEPSRITYERLLKNIEYNGFRNVSTMNVAVSNKNGTATLYDVIDPNQTSASLEMEMAHQTHSSNRYEVSTRTLDLLLEEFESHEVDLIKIDVELHEIAVLEGFARGLQQFNPAFIIEVLKDAIGLQIVQHLPADRYLYFYIDEKNGLKQRDSVYADKSFNYLFIPRSRADYLKLIDPLIVR